MQQSYVKLKIAENEERLKKEKIEKKNINSPNGMAQKDGKYFLVRLEMEVEKINILIDTSEKDERLAQLPEEGNWCTIFLLFFCFICLLKINYLYR